MDEKELLALVDNEFETALGVDGGEIAKERALAWDYYLSKPLGNEIDGHSKVVTSDVADVVGGLMPSLLRLFTTQENLVSFEPVGAEDVDAADQESDYVNYVFFKKNDSFPLLYNWFFDALVQKNGIVKAWWDPSEIVTRESYRGLSTEEAGLLLDDEELEPINRETRVLDDGSEVHDIEFNRISKMGRIRIENVPPEEYRISNDARSLNPSDARFVGHEREVKRSELIEMGFDASIVNDLPSEGHRNRTEEEIARRDKSGETKGTNHDPSQDEILLREAYVRIDEDGDGRSELVQVFVAGNELLSREVVDRQPFHVICPEPLPHKHFGRSVADKVMDTQLVATTLTRQILDNLYRTNNPGHAVWEQGIGDNTLDDLTSSRIGIVARFARPVPESYAPMTVPFTAGATFPFLEVLEKQKRDRTGVSGDAEGLNPEALKNIQTSVLMQGVDLGKMKQEAVARIFAETGIKSLFLHIHELIRKFQNKPEIVRLRNKWVPVDPRIWRQRFDMTVNIGLGIGTREQNLLHLQNILGLQEKANAAGLGGLVVTPRNFYNLAKEIVRNANFKDPNMFFNDPGENPQPPQNPEQIALLKQQNALLEKQAQQEERKFQLDLMKAKGQQEIALLNAKINKDKIDKDHVTDLEKISTDLTKLELESGKNIPGAKV